MNLNKIQHQKWIFILENKVLNSTEYQYFRRDFEIIMFGNCSGFQ